MRFDANYAEEVELRDGSRALLRLIRPSDRARLRIGFHEVSDEGRYRRFLAAKTKLSSAELDYLTDVDQQTHVAIGAAALVGGREGRGLGVARFILLEREPHIADPAVTVIDDAQGVGLGTILFDRLIKAALERGVTRFRSEVLATNDAMMAIMRRQTHEPAQVAGGVALIEFVLPGAIESRAPAEDHAPSQGHEILRLAAERLARVRRFLTWTHPNGPPGDESRHGEEE